MFKSINPNGADHADVRLKLNSSKETDAFVEPPTKPVTILSKSCKDRRRAASRYKKNDMSHRRHFNCPDNMILANFDGRSHCPNRGVDVFSLSKAVDYFVGPLKTPAVIAQKSGTAGWRRLVIFVRHLPAIDRFYCTTAMNPAALWYFECVDLYDTLCPHKVKAMAARHEFRKYKKGAFIYLPDETSTHIYLIWDGQVRIGHYLNDGQEVVSAILVKGEIFGELGLAGEDKRRDFAKAETDTVICPLTLDEMKNLMYGNRELNFKILKLIGFRLMKVERKLELLVFRDARTRIIEFLKDAAAWKGKKVGYETVIHTRLTHKDIAALTATSRQTVTTILNELKDQNIINFDRKRILIRDLDSLR